MTTRMTAQGRNGLGVTHVGDGTTTTAWALKETLQENSFLLPHLQN